MNAARSYKTPKGTDLPLLNLRGKDYLEVKYRIVWFREDHPVWTIETELLSVTEASACARAAIRDEQGRIIATSHKFENKQGFPDFIEKAETGAIGRALALIGYGTQFCADELDEGERLVDSPTSRKPEGKNPLQERRKAKAAADLDPADYVCTFGKFGPNKKTGAPGTRIGDIDIYDLQNYVSFIHQSAAAKGKPIQGQVKEFVEHAEAYLAMREMNQDWMKEEFPPAGDE